MAQYTVTENDGKQKFDPKYVTDVQLSYNFGPFGIFKLGANNLFDATPDQNTFGQARTGTIIDSQGNVIVASPGVFQYSRRSAPFGFNGGILLRRRLNTGFSSLTGNDTLTPPLSHNRERGVRCNLPATAERLPANVEQLTGFTIAIHPTPTKRRGQLPSDPLLPFRAAPAVDSLRQHHV